MATTMDGSQQSAGSGATRRDVIRWIGRVAVASAATTLGAGSLTDSAAARRRGTHRQQRRREEERSTSSRMIETTALPEEMSDSDLAFYGNRCRRWLVCYPDGSCVHRAICRF